jgi:predicted transcriptional regulator
MTKQQLTDLRNKLPHGSLKKIALKLKITQSAVSQVFDGNFKNDSVIDAAIQIAKEEKNRAKKEAKILKKVL